MSIPRQQPTQHRDTIHTIAHYYFCLASKHRSSQSPLLASTDNSNKYHPSIMNNFITRAALLAALLAGSALAQNGKATKEPTAAPTDIPTFHPTVTPTGSPTLRPSRSPTPRPSRSPVEIPSMSYGSYSSISTKAGKNAKKGKAGKSGKGNGGYVETPSMSYGSYSSVGAKVGKRI
jgi:hypothetical protein